MKSKKIISRFVNCILKMVVNYDFILDDIKKCYNQVNGNITIKNFHISEKGKKEIEFALFGFNDKEVISEEVITEMKKANCRPATIWELLMFGNKYSYPQEFFQIVALGSIAVLHSHRRVGYIHKNGLNRIANLVYFHSLWSCKHRFLAVHN